MNRRNPRQSTSSIGKMEGYQATLHSIHHHSRIDFASDVNLYMTCLNSPLTRLI